MAKRNIRQKSTNAQAVLRYFSTTNQGNQMTVHLKSKAQEIRSYVAANPNAKPKDIAKALNATTSYVYTVMWNEKKKAKVTLRNKRLMQAVDGSRDIQPSLDAIKLAASHLSQIEMFEPATDPVNHPAHYKVGGIETIDFIEAKKLGYNLGNVVKYLTRADHKGNRKQDLEKALWYLTREINSLK